MADSPSFTITPALEARFWAKADVKDPTNCWNWLAGQDGNGYGGFCVTVAPNKNIKIKAPQAALILSGIPRPEGAFALHSCDHPPCVNPAHLRWGTAKDNSDDRGQRGRARGGSPGLPGEAHGRAKLTEQQVHLIRRSSATAASLGREFGVSAVLISKIRRRQLWQHI